MSRWFGGAGVDSSGSIASEASTLTYAVAAGLGLAVASMGVMLCGLFPRISPFRNTRWWLAYIGAAAGWLALFTSWPEVYWRGQQLRVRANLDEVAAVAQYLTVKWPSDDGEIPGVGAFLAYPKPIAATLLMLRESHFPHTSLQLSAVEKSTDGAIRFELAGREAGAWLEWRQDDQQPRSFVGGLESSYDISKCAQVAPHWYLVRYRG